MAKIALVIIALMLIGAVNLLELGSIESNLENAINITMIDKETQLNSSESASKKNRTDKTLKIKMNESDRRNSTSIINLKLSRDQMLECPVDEVTDRFSKKEVQPSEIQSPFNCFLPESKCKYYYPANFFDKCGIGKQYAHFLSTAEEKRINGTLWVRMPSMGFPTLTMKGACLVDGKHVSEGVITAPSIRDSLIDIGPHSHGNKTCITERLSFLHVHKAGGTSLHEAFNYMSINKGAVIDRHKFFTPARSPDGVPMNERTTGTSKIYIQTKESLLHATKYPLKEFLPDQHIIFAFVRDPLERFISSIGQATGASGSSGNGIAEVLKKECLQETAQMTLSCMAKYVRDHGFWIELHFTPQVIDISFTTLYQDVPVAIFQFQELSSTLEYFGKGGAHGRDGSNPKYRPDKVLTEMSVADYDDETIRIVCEIYEMDVVMQRSLGIEVPTCDPYIPKLFHFVD